MSEKRKKEEKIILGYEPWGEEIVPDCFFLEETVNQEHLEIPVDQEMARSLWDLLRTFLKYEVKWGKPTIFSEEKYYILLPKTKFIFVIEKQNIQTFKDSEIPVELTSTEKFEKLRNPDASPTCPKHGGHMTHWGEWSCCGDFSFLM